MSGFSIPAPASAMVSVNETYIEHGSIHIIRVSPNQKFRASLHGQPLLLTARTCVPASVCTLTGLLPRVATYFPPFWETGCSLDCVKVLCILRDLCVSVSGNHTCSTTPPFDPPWAL